MALLDEIVLVHIGGAAMLTILFWVAMALVLSVAGFPVFRFLTNGWKRRRYEFYNRLKGDCFDHYRKQFWAGKKPSFDNVYRSIAGRHLYIFPCFLLAVSMFVLGGLAVATSIRQGYEQYFFFYRKLVSPEFAEHLGLTHDTIAQLQGAFWPFDDVMLDFSSLASVAGAYLYVVGVLIQGFRRRSMTATDLLWCSFRLVIAIPMGLSLAALSLDRMGPFVGFALGAFPIDSINRMLRRLLYLTLKDSEKDVSTDRVVFMAGVTPDIASVLNAEGVLAVQQLAALDPVSLAIRTGLAFDFVLNLASQAQAWCFLGDKTQFLAPLGLGDARPIAQLVARMDEYGEDDPQVAAIVKACAMATLVDESALKTIFRHIAEDDYTQFLLNFGPRQAVQPRQSAMRV